MNAINLLSREIVPVKTIPNNMNTSIANGESLSFFNLLQPQESESDLIFSKNDDETIEAQTILELFSGLTGHLDNYESGLVKEDVLTNVEESQLVHTDLINEDIAILLNFMLTQGIIPESLSSETKQIIQELLADPAKQFTNKDPELKGIEQKSIKSIATQLIQFNEQIEQMIQTAPKLLEILPDLTVQLSESEENTIYDEEMISNAKQTISEQFPQLYQLAETLTISLSADEKLDDLDLKTLELLSKLAVVIKDTDLNEINKEFNLNKEAQFTELLTQIKPLLTSITNEEEIIKASPKLLELLNQWTDLERSGGNETSHLLSAENDTKELRLWKDLLFSFQKRSDFAKNSRYNSEAEVTTKDVGKWLKNGFNTLITVNDQISFEQDSAPMPMPKLEQYVIHINQTDQVESSDKQLIKQFQNIMTTGRFTMSNGVNQFTIALRPDNLGEMMVRLTQVNGEMTLKILVSSQTTKQMLESNIKELRSMFSPHQVVIEKQEIDVNNIQKENQDQPLDEHEEDQSNHPNQGGKGDSDDEFEKTFKDLLMNVKV